MKHALKLSIAINIGLAAACVWLTMQNQDLVAEPRELESAASSKSKLPSSNRVLNSSTETSPNLVSPASTVKAVDRNIEESEMTAADVAYQTRNIDHLDPSEVTAQIEAELAASLMTEIPEHLLPSPEDVLFHEQLERERLTKIQTSDE